MIRIIVAITRAILVLAYLAGLVLSVLGLIALLFAPYEVGVPDALDPTFARAALLGAWLFYVALWSLLFGAVAVALDNNAQFRAIREALEAQASDARPAFPAKPDTTAPPRNEPTFGPPS
ncbi:MAG: hypothetical protein AAGJ96_12405 [Pseudomonadota bacterium]